MKTEVPNNFSGMNSSFDVDMKNVIALFQLKACLNLGKLDSIRPHIADLDEKSFDYSFFQAVANIHEAEFEQARIFIDR